MRVAVVVIAVVLFASLLVAIFWFASFGQYTGTWSHESVPKSFEVGTRFGETVMPASALAPLL